MEDYERPSGAETPPKTERGRRRIDEDQRYTPVIVKRTDMTRRHPDDVLEMAIEEGLEQLERPPLSLFLSAVGAGLILGFTALVVGVAKTAVIDVDQVMLQRIATALVYPLGFVVCMTSGTELFTEHTATAVYPVLDRRSGIASLVRLWFLVGSGNLLGTALSSVLLAMADPVVHAQVGYAAVGLHFVDVATLPLVASAILAGWLMALGAWLLLATPPTVSQLLSIYVVTFIIGLGGFHHSIAGTAEVITGWLMGGGYSLPSGLRAIGLAITGNLIGGSLFVAGLNYAHIRGSRNTGP